MKTSTLLVEFENGVAKTKVSVPDNGTPCLYFLSEKGKRAPFYIGEYGKAKGYSVIERITQQFSTSGRLCRVAINMPKFNNTVPQSIVAHIFVLGEDFKPENNRNSLESWVIYTACHVQKIQDKRFAVAKYDTPTHDYSKEANSIVCNFLRTSLIPQSA